MRPVELSSEALQLIKDGAPKPLDVESPVIKGDTQVEGAPREAKGTILEADVNPDPMTGQEVGQSRRRAGAVRPKVESTDDRERLVSLSIRIPESIAEALLRASSERKLKRVKPFTQQEIVADALSAWLKRGGHL